MSDQERDEEQDRAKGYHEETRNTDNKSDLSPSARNKGIKDKIVGKISSTTMGWTYNIFNSTQNLLDGILAKES